MHGSGWSNETVPVSSTQSRRNGDERSITQPPCAGDGLSRAFGIGCDVATMG